MVKSLFKEIYFFFLLLFVLLFSGCGNNPHSAPLKEKRSDGTPWQVSYRAIGEDPRTLDPQVSYDTLGHAVISLVYECMLQYHPFKVDPYELEPALAAAMPQRVREKDGSETYLFEIKKGVYFHDDPCFSDGKGREVTAEDMAYVFKRIADPKVECPILSTLQDYVIGLKEAYEEARKNGSFDYAKPLIGVEVLDRYRYRIRLSKAYPQLLYWMAMPFTAPVPHEAVKYYDGKKHDEKSRPLFKFHPVGTGPFRMVEWQRRRLLRFSRHERYIATTFPVQGWPKDQENRFRIDAGKPLPFLDEIQFKVITESIPAWVLFRQGYLDASGVGKDVFNTVLTVSQELTPKYRDRGVQLYKDAEPSTFFLIFNMEDPIVGKNKKLRQAISSAYDQDLEISIFFNGIYLNAQQLLPPGVVGYQQDFQNPYKKHDLTYAKKLMIEAGYPEGIDSKTGKRLQLKLDVTADDAESRQHAEFQKNQIEQLGVQVIVEENNWARQQEKVDAGHFQIVSYGWHADYPDPENFFFLFYGRNIPPQGNNNARYQNGEFDKIFDRMSTMDNSPQRLQLIRQLNTILTEDCPWVLNVYPVGFRLNQPWSPRVSSNPLLAGGAKYLKVDVALREEKQKEWNQPLLWPLWVAGSMGVMILAFAIIYWGKKQNV